MTDWTTRVVDRLCEMKRAGYDFPEAWRVVQTEMPPRGRDRGEPATSLFDPLRDDESFTEFFRRVCGEAWRGERPALAHLGVLLEAGEVFPEAPRLAA